MSSWLLVRGGRPRGRHTAGRPSAETGVRVHFLKKSTLTPVLYQQQRAVRARAEYAAAKRAGTAETFITLLRADPARVMLSVLAILFALGLVTIPFFLLRG